ncbi:1-deoxy-D-xylulose-5-phosphate reductoisomerase [Candidatus Riflebacteria bacterium]
MLKIAILGSTGSIGENAYQIAHFHNKTINVVALAAHSRWQRLAEQALNLNPEMVCIFEEKYLSALKDALKTKPEISIVTGMDGLLSCIRNTACERVLLAVVGAIGIQPAIECIKLSKTLCLANKESLVAAGPIIMKLARKYKTQIIPVDSEHSAIFQCLEKRNLLECKKIILTASGGPFLRLPEEKFASITREVALKHPNWQMGGKITIDSATMMNKGLELIEAYYLFGQDLTKLQILVHPESIIHSLVEFIDCSMIAHLGTPDMKIPIQFALSYPRYLPDAGVKNLNLAEIGSLNFEEPDLNKFPCLKIAMECLSRGGNFPSALNAANEEVVKSFLQEKIHFQKIPDLLYRTMERIEFQKEPDLEYIMATDAFARKLVLSWI